MKKLFMIGCLLIAVMFQAQAQADAITKYFDKYLDDDRFTVVYISGKMFSLLSNLDSDDEEADEVLEVAKDLRGLRILVAEEDGLSFYNEAKSKINTKEGYEVLMTIRDNDGENVEFLVKEKGDVIEELLLLGGGKDEEGEDDFFLMSFIGNIDLDKISKISNSIDIDGADHLEKLKDRKKN